MSERKSRDVRHSSKGRPLFWRIINAIRNTISKSNMMEFSPSPDFWRESDLESNRRSAPPEDEYIDLRCIWGVEFYTPTHVDTLLDGFRKLGWDKDRHSDTQENLVGWVQDKRRHFYGGSWIRLGTIGPIGGNNSSPWYSYTAPLPEGVKCARFACYSITSSLTCVVMCFEFDEDFRGRFDEALRLKRQTRTKTVKRFHRIYNPEKQKFDDVLRIRSGVANLAIGWFRENLPGVFSSGLLGDELPICEFATLRRDRPFPAENHTIDYLRLLGLDFSTELWRSINKPSLKFAPQISGGVLGSNRQHHSILVAREQDFEEDEIKKIDSLDRTTDSTDERISLLVSRWAILSLLEGYVRSLNNLRDSVTTRFGGYSRQNSLRALQALIYDISYKVDISAVTADLVSSTREPSRFCRGMEGFEACYEWMHQHNFDENICFAVGERATWIHQMDRSLRDHLTQYGSLLAATENIRTQNWILFLTILATILAVISLVISVDIGNAISVFLYWLRSLGVA